MVNRGGLIALAAIAVVGCGYKGDLTRLEPPDPALSREERRAARADEQRTIRQRLRPAADTRPLRIDDLAVKLEERPDDSFALPPEGTRDATPPPFPGEEPAADDPDSRWRERGEQPALPDTPALPADQPG